MDLLDLFCVGLWSSLVLMLKVRKTAVIIQRMKMDTSVAKKVNR